jgi:hypothetical protein
MSNEAPSTVRRDHVQLFFFFVSFVIGAYFNRERSPTIVRSTLLEEYRKWGPHLPTVRSGGELDQLMTVASNEQSIALVGDIRNSHSMMTSQTPQEFSTRMVEVDPIL